MDHRLQVIPLLAVSVMVMVAFLRLHIPASPGYLRVGLILGLHTAGPTVHVPAFMVLAAAWTAHSLRGRGFPSLTPHAGFVWAPRTS